MIKKVTLTLGAGKYYSNYGYTANERYVIELASVKEASPCYYLIEGKAKVYKGKVSKTFLREENFSRKIKKNADYLKLEDVSNSVDFIMED